MKTELTKDGMLKIQAENELEEYALKKWIQDNEEIMSNQKLNKNIVVCWGTDDTKKCNCDKK